MRFRFLAILLLCLPLVSAALQRDSVVLNTPSGIVHGTLTIPDNVKGKVPLVVFIVGSGPTDRNGNQTNFQNNSHLYLADSLAIRGIASLRYDKRGIGQSKLAANESTLRFEHYVDDAAAWVKKYSKDSRFKDLYIAGHSEGSLIGIMAAQQVSIKGLISIAGVALPADSIVFRQLGASPTISSIMLDSMRMLFSQLRRDGHVDNVPQGFYQALLRKSVQPYLYSWIKYNPAQEIAKLKIPVLVLQGTTDVQVDTTQAIALAAAARNSQLLIIEGMNHVLKAATFDPMDSQEAYIMPDRPVNQQLVLAMDRFIQTKGKKK